jgi:predicted DNA-binding ribbon-helix-helix protein
MLPIDDEPDERDIATERHETLSHLVNSVNAKRQHTNLSSAIRLFVLGFYRDQLAAPGPSRVRRFDQAEPRLR